jgi:tetraacyldisaccharide 4'-kinase
MKRNFKINKILIPLSWLYGLGVGIRNKLFDWGIFPTEEFSVPVISIGNITVGGTGKTPHTEYLIRLLSKKYGIAVLSRGYKRKTKGFVLADERTNSSAIGDEPLQMYRKFPGVLVAADSNRRRGIKKLLALPENRKPEVILLDDAFQHRYVTPSLSILLINFNRLIDDDYLLPAGRLREPAKNKSRADIIIYTKCPKDFGADPKDCYPAPEIDFPGKLLFSSTYDYKSLLPVFPENNPIRKESIERLKKESYAFLLLAGFANPDDLIRHLENYTSDLHTLIFPDHHHFKNIDIDKITETFGRITNDKKIIITSEKDAVRLADNPHFPEKLKDFMYYLPIEVVINQEELFIQKIEEHVATFKRNRVMA